METLLEFAKSQLYPARFLIERDLPLRPILCFDGRKGPDGGTHPHGIVAVPMYGEDRAAAHKAIREMLNEFEAYRYAFTMHGYIGQIEPGTPVPDMPEDANAKEAIVISAANTQGEKCVVICEIIRTEDAISFSEPRTLPVPTDELVNLLDTTPTVH